MGNVKTKLVVAESDISPEPEALTETVAVRNIVPKMKIQHALIHKNEKPGSEFAPWELLDQIEGSGASRR